MSASERRSAERAWRDGLPRVEEVVSPALIRYLRQSAVDRYGHAEEKAVKDFAQAFLTDFAGHPRIEEEVARLVLRSVVQGQWATVVSLNPYSDSRADYNAQLIAEGYGLLRPFNFGERQEDVDPVNALRPTRFLLEGVAARLNGDIAIKVTPEGRR